MADYYPLIKKAVVSLDPDVPRESRRALYERARAAQLIHLRAISPPLSEAEITCEQLVLEEAVRRVEVEAAQRGGDVRVPALNDLVAAADGIGKAAARAKRCSSVVQAKALANPFSPNQISIEAPPPMIVTGSTTGRLIRFWRWRSVPPRRVA
jgi:hypothetical protein